MLAREAGYELLLKSKPELYRFPLSLNFDDPTQDVFKENPAVKQIGDVIPLAENAVSFQFDNPMSEHMPAVRLDENENIAQPDRTLSQRGNENFVTGVDEGKHAVAGGIKTGRITRIDGSTEQCCQLYRIKLIFSNLGRKRGSHMRNLDSKVYAGKR